VPAKTDHISLLTELSKPHAFVTINIALLTEGETKNV